MNNEATFNPNELSPAEVAGMALTDPKLKMTSRVRKMLFRNRQITLREPPVKLREARKVGISAKLDKANAKRDARRREGPGMPQAEPKSESDRWVERLNAMPMHRLVRFVKHSARRAASCMHAIKKAERKGESGPFTARLPEEQDRQLALMRAGLRMIQMRVNPPQSNEV
jgi:hypothetical protein